MKQRIKEIVADTLCVEVSEISEESRFIEDLGADSLDVIELGFRLEEELDVDFNDKALPSTVGELIEFVKV